eukprot:3211445-Ditylum_brightwellii.AAC.1
MESGSGEIDVQNLELELLRHLYVEVLNLECVKKYCGSRSGDRFDWLKLFKIFKERIPVSPLSGRRGSAEQLSTWYFPSKDASLRSLQCKLCCKQCSEIVCKVDGLHSQTLWKDTTNTLIHEFIEGHFFSACQRGA